MKIFFFFFVSFTFLQVRILWIFHPFQHSLLLSLGIRLLSASHFSFQVERKIRSKQNSHKEKGEILLYITKKEKVSYFS